MQVRKSVTYYDLDNITEKEIKVLMECIRKSELYDCRDQSLAYDLLREFEELFEDDDKDKDDDEQKQEDNEVPIKFVTLEDSESPYQGIFDIINNAINNKYATTIREELLRKPSKAALERNKKASELVRKLRK